MNAVPRPNTSSAETPDRHSSAGEHSGEPEAMKLSVIMPVHNEERTVLRAVSEVLALDADFDIELIVVDDGSYDGTPLLLQRIDDERLLVHRHSTNLGKGTAVLSGVALATGTHVVIFDADLEYVAHDLLRMFEPIRRGRADVVFGSRRSGANTVYQSFRYAMGNRVTTLVANVLFDAYLSDLHTCLKMLPLDVFRSLSLRERGFGLDSELAAELLRRGRRPFEVPVTYHSRSHAEGKKITWRDGVACLAVLGRVRLRTQPAVSPPASGARVIDLRAPVDDQTNLEQGSATRR